MWKILKWILNPCVAETQMKSLRWFLRYKVKCFYFLSLFLLGLSKKTNCRGHTRQFMRLTLEFDPGFWEQISSTWGRGLWNLILTFSDLHWENVLLPVTTLSRSHLETLTCPVALHLSRNSLFWSQTGDFWVIPWSNFYWNLLLFVSLVALLKLEFIVSELFKNW